MRKIVRFIIRCFNGRLFRSYCRWTYAPLLCILFSILFVILCVVVIIIYSAVIYRSNRCCSSVSNTIVSLTSTPARFHYELPFAVHSLLSQTRLPAQIRIYLSPASAIVAQSNLTLVHLRLALERLDSSARLAVSFDERVHILHESKDYGPATKFLPIIKEFHATKFGAAAIMVCDDDHYYHSHTLATLDKYAEMYPNSIVGLRGWRSKRVVPPILLTNTRG